MAEEKNFYWINEFQESIYCPFTYGQLRQFLQKRNENGFDQVIGKIGKRIYIDKDRFNVWFRSFFKEEKND